MGKNASPDAGSGNPAGRFFGLVALFALVGPAVGGLVVSVFLAVLAATPQLEAGDWAQAATVILTGSLFGTMFGLPIAYFVGILPAAGVGLAVAGWDCRKGLISGRIATAAGFGSWLIVAMAGGDLITADEATRIWQAALLLAHLVATGMCWWTARSIFGRSMPPNPIGA